LFCKSLSSEFNLLYCLQVHFVVPQNNATGFIVTFNATGPNGTIESYPNFPPIQVIGLVPGEQYQVTVHAQGFSQSDGQKSEAVTFVAG